VHRAHRWSQPYPPSAVFHLVKAPIYSLCVHHMFPSSNCHLHEHVLSSHRGRLLLIHGRVFLYRSSWPPTDLSERIVHFAKRDMSSCNVSVVCSLFVHHMFPNSNCRVHAQVLSSHGGRLLHWQVHVWFRRPGASWSNQIHKARRWSQRCQRRLGLLVERIGSNGKIQSNLGPT